MENNPIVQYRFGSNLSKLSPDELVELLTMSEGSKELACNELARRSSQLSVLAFLKEKEAKLSDKLEVFDIIQKDERFKDCMHEARELLPIREREPMFGIDL